MTTYRHVATALLVAALLPGAALAQNPNPNPRPGDDPRQRAREAAARARDAAGQQREREAQQRRDQDRGPEFTEMFTRTIRIGRNGIFDLSNVAGDITITGGNGDDVKIDAVKRVRERSEADARALLQEIGIQVSQRSNQVEVRTDFPRRRNWSGSVDYTVTVPNSTNVTLHTVSGDVRVSNVRGELRADSVSGDVTGAAIGKLRALKTVSGDMQVSDSEGDDITAESLSGDVTIRNLKGRSIDVKVVSGATRLTNVTVERANFRTISGDIDYAGKLARNGRYELLTQSGNIRFVPDGGFDMEATTFSGNVNSDYALTLNSTTPPGGDGRRGRGPGRQLRGTFGDAGAVVTLRSFNGDISITRR